MEYIEVSAKNIDDAITKALIQLETTSDKIEYEIIEKGSNGLLGFIGSKPAVIKAWRKADQLAEEPVKPEIRAEKSVQPVKEEVKDSKASADDQVKKPAARKAASGNSEAAAKEFLDKIFAAMKMEVQIDITRDREEKTMDINLSGEDMGVLIGKRGQTLDSLQYLVSLIVNKEEDDYIRVKLDTENYRERRKETLETLARNIAYKVKRTKRPVSLEPMNPYERRIIHSALQNDKYVVTRSEGEDPYRHVVISLKRERYHK